MAETLAETWALRAYNGGMLAGWARPEVREAGLTGFEHVSVEDERTSEVCREHDHTKRPVADIFWLQNTPPLHYRCRSWLRPLFGPFTPTDLPVIRPDPGFGAAPLFAFGHAFYRAA
jgi:SPP1 gp7 family putative phage head morphogenesis protein